MKASVGPNIDFMLDAIQQVVGSSSKEHPISLHEPVFTGTQAWAYVKDCLDTGWVSTAGSWVSRFEEELCSITGANHAVVVSNGTVALRLALHLVGVGQGDEVLLPPLSFVATANAVAHLGAVNELQGVIESLIELNANAGMYDAATALVNNDVNEEADVIDYIVTLSEIIATQDDFPASDIAFIDTDTDGMPNFFLLSATEAQITASGLTADSDSDGDGIADEEDTAPLSGE